MREGNFARAHYQRAGELIMRAGEIAFAHLNRHAITADGFIEPAFVVEDQTFIEILLGGVERATHKHSPKENHAVGAMGSARSRYGLREETAMANLSGQHVKSIRAMWLPATRIAQAH